MPIDPIPRLTRAEAARRNGALSRGARTATGKFIARMNGYLVDGVMPALPPGDLPHNYALLSFESRRAYWKDVQANTRQYQVTTEAQLKLIRMMTSELWMYSRLCGLQNALDQSDFEQAELDFPDLSQFARSGKAAINQREWAHVHALIERRKAGHLRAWNSFSRGLERMKKMHPMTPAESLDFQADLAALAQEHEQKQEPERRPEPEPAEPRPAAPPASPQPVNKQPLTSLPRRPDPPQNDKPMPGMPARPQPRPYPKAA